MKIHIIEVEIASCCCKITYLFIFVVLILKIFKKNNFEVLNQILEISFCTNYYFYLANQASPIGNISYGKGVKI